MRYINALPATIEDFMKWFKPGITGWPVARSSTAKRNEHGSSWTQLEAGKNGHPVDGGVIRYGYLPGGVGIDVASTEAATQPSFLADVDLVNSAQRPFDPAALATLFQEINHLIADSAHTLSEDGRKQFGLRPKE